METTYLKKPQQRQNKKNAVHRKNITRVEPTPESTAPISVEAGSIKSDWVFEPHMYVIFGLVFVTALAIFAALRLGTDYYLASLAERPQYALHNTFKPSGLVGQGFGFFGGLFCLLTLLYPLRKRWRWLENLGAPRPWFQFHIYFGIAGPLLATMHTTFKFGGLASICYWSMMLVMASGFVGRFLFVLLPRNQRGVMLSLHEIDAEIRVVQQHFTTMGVNDEILSHARQQSLSLNGTANWPALLRLWKERRHMLHEWDRRLRVQGLPVSITRRVLSLLSRKFFLESSRFTLEITSRAFSHWHTLHLPFTYLMFITLAIHVVLAIFLGYTWIF
jgi:hypothetical protein